MKQYLINCVGSTAELISAMVEQAEEITYEELLQHVTQEELDSVFTMYEDCPLTLEKDWHVSYFKSIYDGEPCVYVCHSAIEYVFV